MREEGESAEEEGAGARCTESLWGLVSDVALLLPSPVRDK